MAILKKEKNFLIFIFLVAFFIRALFFCFYLKEDNRFYMPDSPSYHDLATQIAKGNGITCLDGSDQFVRIPGYSIFLAFFYKLFGEKKEVVLWIQLFLSCLIPIIIFVLSVALFPAQILLAKLSAIYSVIHLGFIYFSGIMMAETIFCLFFYLFLIFFISAFDPFFCMKNCYKFSYKKLFAAGLFLGLASLVRPVGHYLVLLLFFLILFSKEKFLTKLKGNLLFLGGWFLIIFGWVLRNYLLTGLIFFHTLTKSLVFHYSAPNVLMQTSSLSCEQAKEMLRKQAHLQIQKIEEERGYKLNKAESCFVLEKVCLHNIKKHPIAFLKHCVINWTKTIVMPFSEEVFVCEENKGIEFPKKDLFKRLKYFILPNVSHSFLIPIIYFDLILFLFIFWGFLLFIFYSFYNWIYLSQLFKCLPIIALIIAITFGCGYSRLRIPVEPFLIIFAFKFWMTFLNNIKVFGNEKFFE